MPYNSVELITSHWRAFLPFNSRCHGGCETFANLNSYKFNSGAGKSAISYTETAIIRGIPRKSFSLCGSFEATKWTSFTCAAHAENFWPTILGNTKRLQNEVFIISFQLLTCCDSWSSGYNGLYTKHAYAREGFASLKKKNRLYWSEPKVLKWGAVRPLGRLCLVFARCPKAGSGRSLCRAVL